MIDGPRTVVKATPAKQLSVAGSQTDAAQQTLAHWFDHNQLMFKSNFGFSRVDQLPMAFEIQKVATRHSGFGSGTQLAMAVTAAAFKCLGLPTPGSKDLAIASGRGKRSAIGSHGFLQGGFLVDRGKRVADALAPLELRLDFPIEWPIVTIVPWKTQGLSGQSESSAFKNLPDSSAAHRQQMIDLVKNQMVNSIIARDYQNFARSVYEFGHRSGSMFETMQGGKYNGDAVTQTVNLIRSSGVEAVGQSSWGPCVFAILENDTQATKLVEHLTSKLPSNTEITVRRADNQGALWSANGNDS